MAEEAVPAAPSGMMGKFDNFFKITERKSTVMTEFRAGTATFMTLCYILAVNSRLLSESGGYCEPAKHCTAAGFEAAGPFCVYDDDPGYLACREEFRRQLITITALSSCVACLGMGLFANLPFALAPGMGLNAYFTYDVVGFHGTGPVKWKTALAAIFIEGIIFVVLTVTGLRTKAAKMIPESLKYAMTGGIGMFLAHLGLQTAEGIGLVVTDMATGLTLGACPPASRQYATYTCDGPGLTADSYTCDGDNGSKMQSATTWLGIITLFVIGIMLVRGVRGALIIGIIFATVVSWFKGTEVSYFEDDVYPLAGGMLGEQGIVSGGQYRWDYFSKVVKLEPIKDTWFQFDFGDMSGKELGIALFTFLYVDLFDTTGTLFAMAKFAGFTDAEGNFPGMTQAFVVDGVATSFGACIGTSPVTTYIESAPGIEEGGRTGLTAVFVGLYFLVSIFFAPLLASVPPWATGPALIIVGAMMMRSLVNIDWMDYGQAIPAFVTIILMPLTYSIAYGLVGGIFTWCVINGADFAIEKAMGGKKYDAPAVEATKVEPAST